MARGTCRVEYAWYGRWYDFDGRDGVSNSELSIQSAGGGIQWFRLKPACFRLIKGLMFGAVNRPSDHSSRGLTSEAMELVCCDRGYGTSTWFFFSNPTSDRTYVYVFQRTFL